jgi:HK97 family phage prohead protease
MTVTPTSVRTPDFTGYATRFDRECSDGRTIKHGAFLHQDGQQVPLVWQHQHDNPENVLGHAILHHREDGIYTEAFFNDTDRGRHAKAMVQHGDIKALSIFATKLKQRGGDVMHGMIGEVSLVYRGANPGAHIEDVNLQHSGDGTDTMYGEAIIYSGEEISLYHADASATSTEPTVADVVASMSDVQKTVLYALLSQASTGSVRHADTEGDVQHSEDDDEDEALLHVDATDQEVDVNAVIDSLTPIQLDVFHSLIGEALDSENSDGTVAHSEDESEVAAESNDEAAAEDKSESEEEAESKDEAKTEEGEKPAVKTEESDDSEEDKNLQHNQEGSDQMSKYSAFENGGKGGTTTEDRYTLTHSDVVELNELAKEKGSFKKAYESFTLQHADYGITNIDILFPDARVSSSTPELIARQTEWVQKVISATKHSPFAKVKTILADLTAEEARAKGYVKGSLKKDEVIPLMQRSTSPATVYKKQKLDRDDVIDITDIDIITWLKWEIRFMLNEEIARAILIGDGRPVGHADKIKDPQGQLEGTGIRSIANDHDLYAHKVELAANVSPATMIDDITRARTNYRGSGSPSFYTTDSVLTELLLLKDKMGRRLYETEAALAAAIRVKEIVPVEVMEETPTLLGIIVNLIDYTVGTNKGGEITSFDDFDIDFNQYKYLMETRMSGALTKPKSALVITRELGTEAVASAPTFDSATNTLTIPSQTGVEYLIDGQVVASGDRVITESTDVVAEPKEGFYLKSMSTRNWTFSYTAP